MIFVSNWPALPTNGSPCTSSSAPGASPTNINGELISPTPNTTFLRDLARCGHLTQIRARWRNSAMAAAFASGPSEGGAGITDVSGVLSNSAGTGDSAIGNEAGAVNCCLCDCGDTPEIAGDRAASAPILRGKGVADRVVAFTFSNAAHVSLLMGTNLIP